VRDILIETGESSVTADVVKKVFFHNDPTAKVLRHRIRQKPFGRGLVPEGLMDDARFRGFSSEASTTLAGDELKAVINCLREAAVDGSVDTSGWANAALEFCNREGWLQQIKSGKVQKFEVPSKLHLW